MESRAKLLGHPIHQMLVVFPLGLLSAAVLFDIAWLSTGNRTFGAVAYWNIAAGVVCGLISAVFGLWDWLAIPAATRAKAVGMWHGLGNVVVVALFAASWSMRYFGEAYAPATAAVGLGVAGVLLALVTGWLGGELVDRLAVGVDPGAHLNSPSSLSGLPASLTVPPDEPASQERRAA